MALIKKNVCTNNTVGWMCLTYRRATPANTVWEEINSATLAMQSDMYKGVHTAHAHSCASSITNQTNKAHLTGEKALAGYKGASCTEWDKERHRGEMQESSETVRKWGMCSSPFSIIGSRSHRLFCSFAPLLYLALTAVGCCRLSQWDGTGVTKICIKLQSERCDG